MRGVCWTRTDDSFTGEDYTEGVGSGDGVCCGSVAVAVYGVGGVQREAVAAGVLTQLLLLVQSECTERAKRKAQMLLKLLRDSWPEHTVGNSDEFACSDVVPY